MALSYYYTFSAPKSIPSLKLESFLNAVEAHAKKMGFNPSIVMNALFATDDQRKFVRRITSGLLISDERLKGATLLDGSRVWNYDRERGECRVIPEKGVILVVTDEHGCETAFGFLWYPDTLLDLNGKELAAMPHQGRWFFHDFVDTPDKRYRTIVKMFANEGYLESEKDEYMPS
jgi:hypothetical protein